MTIIIFIIQSLFAGVLTFFSSAWFLVPAYLGLISLPVLINLKNKNFKNKIFLSGASFVIGLVGIFIYFNIFIGLTTISLSLYRFWLSRLAGILVIIFGWLMIKLIRLDFLDQEKIDKLIILRPRSNYSFLLGAFIAFGWLPKVGQTLGSILLLIKSLPTIGQGIFFMFLFALGLAMPFLLIAKSLEKFYSRLEKIDKYLKIIFLISGVSLIVIGCLLLIGKLGIL